MSSCASSRVETYWQEFKKKYTVLFISNWTDNTLKESTVRNIWTGRKSVFYG